MREKQNQKQKKLTMAFRIESELLVALRRKSRETGVSISHVLRKAAVDWLGEDPRLSN